MTEPDRSRRAFVTRGAYIAPAILTLAAAPEFAKAGSIKDNPGKGKGKDKDKDKDPDKPGKGPK